MIEPVSLQTLCKRFGGYVFGKAENTFDVISADSRTLAENSLFVALKGASFDGHDYIEDALTKGAKGLVVHKAYKEQLYEKITTEYSELSVWLVDDTTKALGQIAEYNRDLFSQPLIALTGSSGKTTVKGMLLQILSVHAGSEAVFATRGNLNNHFGVPFSLLELSSKHQYAVIEMGASAVGEIDYLTHIAKPNAALVNNVMPAHIEGFGTMDAIARAKGEIYEGLLVNGVAVINGDDAYANQWVQQNHQRSKMIFSVAEGKTVEQPVQDEMLVQAKNSTLMKNGCYSFCLFYQNQSLVIELKVLGKHNVANAVAAAACAFALGIDIEIIAKGLQYFSGENGRLQVSKGLQDCTLIDDTYNANPGSVKAAIDVLATIPSETVLVLGDMAELGDIAEEQHHEIGQYAADKNIGRLLTVGEKSVLAQKAFGDCAFHFDTMESLIEVLSGLVTSNTSILVKGSRSAKMERVIHALKTCGDNANASVVC